MDKQLTLLSDEQMRQFLTYGYLKLNAEFPSSFHEAIHKKIRDVYDSEGNVGNNLLPRIPEIGTIFEDPTIKGALTSLLGKEYIMSSHRHGHLTKQGKGNVHWHKDNYWLNEKIRNHRTWSALIFYYTQDVTEEMGPSMIRPGTQNYYNLLGDDSEPWIPVCGKAGTLALIDYDLWHTASVNRSDIDRFMLKFQFFRMEAPKAPAWDNREPLWRAPAELNGIDEHHLQWRSVWNWLAGRTEIEASTESTRQEHPDLGTGYREDLKSEDRLIRMKAADGIGRIGPSAAEAIPALSGLLHEKDEGVSLNAAYALGAMGADGIPVLVEGLRSASHPTACNAAHGLIDAGPAAVPALLDLLNEGEAGGEARAYAAFALGEIGAEASVVVPALAGLLRDSSPFVRQHAVEALGFMRSPEPEAIEAMTEMLLHDPKDFLRFQAGLALARLGPLADKAVPALKQALTDPYRYVPGIAADALDRIRTPEALAVLVPFLKRARWCPITTRTSTY